jgi:hypothetical protein
MTVGDSRQREDGRGPRGAHEGGGIQGAEFNIWNLNRGCATTDDKVGYGCDMLDMMRGNDGSLGRIHHIVYVI